MADVAAALRAALAEIAGARDRAVAGIMAARSAHMRLAAVAAAAGNPLPQRALRQLAAAIDRLLEADNEAAGAAAAIIEYGRVIGASLPTPASPAPTPAGVPASQLSGVPASPTPPPAVDALGRSLPVRVGRTDPTTGVFNGERIASRDDETLVADLRPFPGGGWPRAVISHVEGHVAARMRRDGLTNGELVINNVACGNRGFDADWPLTCDRLLAPILPAGARLTVWGTPDGGRTWWTKTYIDTGERIKP